MKSFLLSALLPCLPMSAASVQEILARAVEVESAMVARRASFGYDEVQENYDGDSSTPRIRRYDNIFLEGKPYRKLIEKNGKPLSKGEQRSVDEALARTARERREARKRKAPFFPGTRYFRIGELPELVKLLDFRVVQSGAAIANRTAFLLEAEAKPDLVQVQPGRAELACYRQRFWIDGTDFFILRREAEVLREGAELLPGTVLVSDYGAVGAEGTWFETRREIDFRAKVFGIRKAKGRQIHTYSSFRKFDVESTITFEEKP
jgi:hypothetical protein